MSQEDMNKVIAEAVEAEILRRSRESGAAGGRARAAALTPRRRRALAKKASQARWGKKAK